MLQQTQVVTVIPLNFCIVIAAAVFVVYFSIGGILVSAVTNLIHVVVIYLGLTAVAVAGFNYAGGCGSILAKVNSAIESCAIVRPWSRTQHLNSSLPQYGFQESVPAHSLDRY